MGECTAAKFLEEGYRMTDHVTGADIAVLINGRFIRWAAGGWQPNATRKKIKKLKAFQAAKKAAALRQR